MLVCSCHAVSEQTVRAAIEAGARDEEQVGERCWAGTFCGGCLGHVCELLAEAGVPEHGCGATLAS